MTSFNSAIADLDVTLLSSWETGLVAEFSLTGNEALLGWTIAFDYAGEIEDIWNARIVSRSGDRYVVESVDSSSSVGSDGSAGFGLRGEGSATAIMPVSINGVSFAQGSQGLGAEPMLGASIGNATAESVVTVASTAGDDPNSISPIAYSSHSNVGENQQGTGTYQLGLDDWDSGFVARYFITPSEAVSGGWTVSIATSATVSNVWNAEIVSQQNGVLTLGNASWNANIAAGETIEVGLQGSGSAAGIDLVASTLPLAGVVAPRDPVDDGSGDSGLGDDQGTGDGSMGGDDQGSDTGSGDTGSGGSGPFAGGGQTYAVGQVSVVTGFDPATDALDLGPSSIHNQIPVDTPDGFMMMNIFNASQSMLLEGVRLADLHPESFLPIGDAHLQQDLSAILAYEDGSGLVRPNTVYARSHEQGVEETVDFDPATDKVSFFYLSVRGDGQLNFAVEDTAEGARFYSPLTGQSLTLRGVSFADLDSSHFEWRANQLEDGIAGRIGLEAVIDGFSYPGENIFSGKSVAMAGGVDRAPYHSVQGHEEYTGTPIGGGTGDETGGGSGDGMGDGGSGDGGMGDMGGMDDYSGHDHGGHNHGSNGFTDITEYGVHHGTSSHTHHDSLEGGRTAITTEAMIAYNALRNFLGLQDVTIDDVGTWAFAEGLTNNTQAWGGDLQGVGLWYAMQGAKVGWIRDDAFDPQILADIQREARLGDPAEVMEMVETFGHAGFTTFLTDYGLDRHFIETLKMEPHYGGWMHGRTHGWLNFPEGGAIAHDVNHLTVLSHDQTQPFMNDTFDWPQWPALNVPWQDVIDYFQSMVVLGDPFGGAIPEGFVADPLVPPNFDPLVLGTLDSDDMVGGGQGETMMGLAGDDTVSAGGGDDVVDGGLGDDLLDGGAGVDTLSFASQTAPGFDLNGILFGAIVDLAQQGVEQDTGQGLDTFTGFEKLEGSDFNDGLFGDAGDNTIEGGGGSDFLTGEAGDDTLFGGADTDVLEGGAGADALYGGTTGNGEIETDIVAYFSADGPRTFVFGTSISELEAGTSTEIIDDVIGDDIEGVGGADAFSNTFDAVDISTTTFFLGGRESDTFFGGSGTDQLLGVAGDDVMYGNEGRDALIGEGGDDDLYGGAGADAFFFDSQDGTDTIHDLELGAGGDVIFFTGGNVTALRLEDTDADRNDLKDTLMTYFVGDRASGVITIIDHNAQSVLDDANFIGVTDIGLG